MSIKMMTLAWKLPLNSTETLVVLALADAATDEGFCFPGYESLIEKTKLARSTLSKTLSILEGAGIFEKKAHSTIGKGRSANTYQLLFDESWYELVKQPPPKSPRLELIDSLRCELIEKINELRKEQKRPISSSLEPRKVQPSDAISTRSGHESSYKHHTESSLNIYNGSKPKKSEKSTAGGAIDLLGQYGVHGQLADDFIVHRKSKKSSITATVLNGFQREADKAGITLVEAITVSIERGWQGFKAEWLTSSTASANNQTKGISRHEWNSTNF